MDLDLKMTRKQSEFLDSTAFETLFGGAAGGGKSYGQVLDAFLYALKFKESRQLILRRTYPELEQSILPLAFEIFPKTTYFYNQTKKEFRFRNGSILKCGYLGTEKDVYNYQGTEFDVIRFDELTHFTEFMYIYLMSRVRGKKPYPRGIKSSTNPGGVGHSWVKERFIDIGKWGETHQMENGTRLFLPSLVTDNHFLLENDPMYLKRLENLPEVERKRLRFGDWDVFDGRFFAEFDRNVHVCKPFVIPRSWRVYEVFDFGLDCFAFYRIALSDKGKAYVFDEIHEGGHIVSEAASLILKTRKKGDWQVLPYSTFAPPDIFGDKGATGRTAAEIFHGSGVKLTKVKADRCGGLLDLKEWLKVENGEANLVIFDNCKNLIKSLSTILADEHNPQDVAISPHALTHAVDALRYFSSGRPRGERGKSEKGFSFFKESNEKKGEVGKKVKKI